MLTYVLSNGIECSLRAGQVLFRDVSGISLQSLPRVTHLLLVLAYPWLRPLHKTGITQATYRELNEPNNCSYRLGLAELVNLFCFSSFSFIPFRQ